MMINFMKLKIGSTRDNVYNVFYDKVEEIKSYYIYKSYLFGLIRIPLKFSTTAYKIVSSIKVSYLIKSMATRFDNKYEAEELIKDIYNNPNKYILDNDL